MSEGVAIDRSRSLALHGFGFLRTGYDDCAQGRRKHPPACTAKLWRYGWQCAPRKAKWGIYATHYLGLATLRDRIARPLILQLSQEARRQRRMSPQQRAFEAQRKRAALLKRQREQ